MDSGLNWCGQRDLNSYGVNHTPLKRARLPVPPRPRMHAIRKCKNDYIDTCPNCQAVFESVFQKKKDSRQNTDEVTSDITKLIIMQMSAIFSENLPIP